MESLRLIWKERLTEVQKDLLRIAAAVLGLAALGAGAYFGGLPIWRRWQGRHSLAQAEVFAQRRDYASLLLSLQRAIHESPGDVATWSAAGRLLAEIGSPTAVMAREQAARLAPADQALRLAWIEDALRFGRLGSASTALEGVGPEARDAAFHRLAAAVALAFGRAGDLREHLAALVAANPSDVNARFSYAAIRLWDSDPVVAGAGRVELEALLSEPAARVRAAIELLADAGERRDAPRMQRTVQSLLAVFAPSAPADFSGAEPAAWISLLKGMKAAAAASPADAALMARWLSDLGRRNEALAWLEGLPFADAGSAPALDVDAQLNAEEGNLGRFETLLRRGAWGPVPFDAVTLAVASRLQAVRYDPARGHATWSDALAACGASDAGLRALVRMAQAWRDPEDAETALEAVVSREPEAYWAYGALRNSYAARRDLVALARLYGRWSAQRPSDPAVAAQWIELGCILDQVTPDMAARAQALRAEGVRSEALAVACAGLLWRRGRLDEAWQALAALPEAERLKPGIAFWVAMVQADRGRRAEARAAILAALGRKADFAPEARAALRKAADKAGLPPADF